MTSIGPLLCICFTVHAKIGQSVKSNVTVSSEKQTATQVTQANIHNNPHAPFREHHTDGKKCAPVILIGNALYRVLIPPRYCTITAINRITYRFKLVPEKNQTPD